MADLIRESAGDKQVGAASTPDFSDNIAASKNDVKQYSAKDNVAAALTVKLNGFPTVEVGQALDSGVAAIEAKFATSPEDKAIFSGFGKLAKRTGGKPLDDSQKWQIEHMSADQKEMFRFTMGELNNLADGKGTPADYMTNNLKNAARLAEANGRKPDSWNIFQPTPGELYRDYVGLVFSEHSLGFKRDLGRSLAGGGLNHAGSALEDTYHRLIAGKAGQGFNSNVTDISPNNSVTHHHREVLLVAYNSGKFVADKATRYLDDPAQNPGDVRSGYFTAMVGSALAAGKLKPSEAAGMTAWAYNKRDGAQPPWGSSGAAGKFVDTDDYKIDVWLKAYRAAGK